VKADDTELAVAELAKGLADPSRVRLLNILVDAPKGGLCVMDLVPLLELSQPTVSHHLKRLRERGLVKREKVGVHAYYTITATGAALRRALHVQVARLQSMLEAVA
jgi:DNA-binding transcriptional ArsR family regulator